MSLPRVYPIVDDGSWIPRLAAEGVRLVQLRIKEQPQRTVRAQIEAAHGYCRAAGVQLIVTGLMGEYLWRVLEESRARPPFLVDTTVNTGAEAPGAVATRPSRNR